MRTKLIILFVFIVGLLTAQTVYIDPSQTDPAEDGTITHPYNSWSDVSFTNNYTYLQKCGTFEIRTSRLIISRKHGITLGSYGAGNKPIIQKANNTAGDNIEVAMSRDITIDGFELIGWYHDQFGNICVGVGSNYSEETPNQNIVIQNCYLHNAWGAVYGIRYNPEHTVASDSIAIINCNIWDISEDGIYLDYSTNPRIMNCHLWNIGMEWFEHVTAPGDGIQLTWGCTNMKIWNTIVDRRTTAGKFSIIIAANDNTNPDYNVSLIGNTIYTPKDTLPRWEGDQVGGAGLYITDCYSVVVARNTFIGRGYNGYPNPTSGEKGQGAVYILQNGRTDIYYNVFDSVACGGQISACDPLYFYNNTIMSDQTTDNPSLQFKIRLSGIDNGIYANNISAGSVTYPGLIVQTSSMTALTNLSSTTNPSTWNAYFGIEDWTTSNYALSSTASIAYNTGTSHSYGYDIDSVAVPQSTLYDIGAYEFAGEAPPPVVDPPIANFSASSLEINETQTVQFTDLSTETPTSWAWVFEGGTPATSAAQNPLITYNTAGTYTVTLTATNAGGSDDEIKTNFITVRTENAAPRGSVLMDGTNVLLYNGNPVKY